MGALIEDVKYGIRMLRKSPGFTAVAVLTLALGIGANTAMFSYVNAWVIHPLPYPHSDRLTLLLDENTKTGARNRLINAGNFYDFQRDDHDFEQISGVLPASLNLTGSGTPERVDGARVTWNFFDTLGAKATLGRTFLPQEDEPGAGHVAIISRGLWETRFAGDPEILGRKIQIDGETYVVVGVMPAKFQLPLTGRSNVWIPMALSSEQRADRQGSWIFALGQMKPGVSLAQAQGELKGLASGLAKAYPTTNVNSTVVLHTLEYEIGSNQGNQEILICFWIVGLVLLIACANVANLMLARATGRTKELAVRTALGAGKWRLIRQLMTETIVLFLVAGAAGMEVAYWIVSWLGNSIPEQVRGYLTNYGQVSLDYETLVYTIGIAFVTGMIFGLAPAMGSSKLDVFATLKEASGRASSTRQGSRLRNAFVVVETALAVVVIVCSALLATKFIGLVHQDPGFQPENVITAQLTLPETKYASPVEVRDFYDRLLTRLSVLPQVERVGASQSIPFGECCGAVPVLATDKPRPPADEMPYAEFSAVTPGYFEALHTAILRGRSFTAADGPSAAPVVVINETLAKYLWPGEDAVDRKVQFTAGGVSHVATVAGVVADVKLYNSTTGKHDREIYAAFEQLPSRSMGIVVRSGADLATLANAVRSTIWNIDADQPVSTIRPLQSLMNDQFAGFQILTDLLGYFSFLALFLGAIGIYAVMAFSVAQRTHEMGIRMALGAHPRQVLRLVLGRGARLTGLGLGIGVAIAMGAARVLNSFLIDPNSSADGTLHTGIFVSPIAFAGAVLLFVIVALAACYLPARRAMRVDPIVALRYE